MAAPDSLISSTINYYLPMVGDNFYKGSSFLMRIRDHEGAKKVAGGEQIREPILAFNPNSDWFTGDEPYTAADNKELSSAVYDWKFVRSTPMITKVDLFKNSGDAAKVSLVKVKMQAASMEVTEKFLSALFAIDTLPVQDAILPLEQLINDGTTYSPGGISSTDVARWAGRVATSGGAAFALAKMFSLYYDCSEGMFEPTDIMLTKNGFGIFAAALQTQQRFLDRNADAGFTNFTFNKAICHFDSHISTVTGAYTGERAYFVNLNTLRMYTGTGLDFASEEKAPSGQSIYTWEIILATAVTTNMRWANGVYHNFV
jgi:hypothetical protein